MAWWGSVLFLRLKNVMVCVFRFPFPNNHFVTLHSFLRHLLCRPTRLHLRPLLYVALPCDDTTQVLPEIRRLAAPRSQEGNEIVVVSHCSKKQEMCTHYVPLSQGVEFLAGQPTMEEQRMQFANDSHFFDFDKFSGGVHKLSRYVKQAFGMAS